MREKTGAIILSRRSEGEDLGGVALKRGRRGVQRGGKEKGDVYIQIFLLGGVLSGLFSSEKDLQ